MNLFVDTSALVKYYYPEADSLDVERLILAADRIYLSELSLVEFASALMKKIRMKELDEKERHLIWEAFLSDIQAESIEFIGLAQEDFHAAADRILELGRDHSLRTLDALQLASALKVDNARFLAADTSLNSIAQELGLSLAGSGI
ncbi:MAG: type II toxin-antitoxin system VapC family toxin [Candidatus Aquicultor sp.]|nr:type II toxin-antitoxin system VapC family toxin [Candidatus Aquicultor sp.]